MQGNHKGATSKYFLLFLLYLSWQLCHWEKFPSRCWAGRSVDPLLVVWLRFGEENPTGCESWLEAVAASLETLLEETFWMFSCEERFGVIRAQIKKKKNKKKNSD